MRSLISSYNLKRNMSNDGQNGGSTSTAEVQNPKRRKINQAKDSTKGVDLISSLPSEILHHILSFVPTKLSIRTSVLSKSWRHVWCEVPSLSFVWVTPSLISQTLAHYRASKMTRLNITTQRHTDHVPDIDSWIDFAVSHKVENLSMKLGFYNRKNHSLPDSFFVNSSMKKLKVELHRRVKITPRGIVSWTSVRSLSLRRCNFFDESIVVILSGCPLLKTLSLSKCILHECLDLSKSRSLTRLEIYNFEGDRVIELVAPHIRYLRIANSDHLFTLVDVSSVTKAHLGSSRYKKFTLDANSLRVKMLKKLYNVERLSFGPILLQILSLAKLCGVPFPKLKVQTLMVNTRGLPSVIPGIVTLLQNSPGLKNLIVHIFPSTGLKDRELDKYLHSNGLTLDQSWRSKYEVVPTSENIYKMTLDRKDGISKHLALFMELMLRNTKTLERMVVWLGCVEFCDTQWVEEQHQMVQTLAQRNNVSIMLKVKRIK